MPNCSEFLQGRIYLFVPAANKDILQPEQIVKNNNCLFLCRQRLFLSLNTVNLSCCRQICLWSQSAATHIINTNRYAVAWNTVGLQWGWWCGWCSLPTSDMHNEWSCNQATADCSHSDGRNPFANTTPCFQGTSSCLRTTPAATTSSMASAPEILQPLGSGKYHNLILKGKLHLHPFLLFLQYWGVPGTHRIGTFDTII